MTELTHQHQFVPAGPDAKGQPTLLMLHGTGGDEHDLLPLGRELLPGAALLSPRGQVLENGMPRFFRRLALGVFDEQDLRERTNRLADFVQAAAARYSIPSSRIIAAGYSNGANIAAAMLLLRPEVLAGAVLLRPTLPLIPDSPPDLAGKAVWIGAATMDEYSPRQKVEQLQSILEDAGARVTIRWANAGHGLTAGDTTAAKEWLRGLTSSA